MMKLISRLLIAFALLGFGSLALAAPGHDHDRHRGHSQHQRDHRQHGHHERDHDRSRRHDNGRRYNYSYRYRHAGPRYVTRHHRWERGHRYYGPSYVVRDYHRRHLRSPPRGYRWVRADSNYLLVAIATGIILDIALQ